MKRYRIIYNGNDKMIVDLKTCKVVSHTIDKISNKKYTLIFDSDTIENLNTEMVSIKAKLNG